MNTALRDPRWRKLAPLLAGWFAVVFVVFTAGFWMQSGSVAVGLLAGSAFTLLLGGAAILVGATAWSHTPASRARRTVLIALWSLGPAACAGLSARYLFALSPPAATLVALAVGAVAALVYGRRRGRDITALQVTVAIVDINDRDGARAVARDATTALADRRLPRDRRTVASLNRARAQVFLALDKSNRHLLQDALAALRAAVTDPATDPASAVLAADDLVNAMSLAAEQTRDPQGYDEAHRLLEQCLRRVPQLRGSARLHAHRANFHLYRAREAIDLASSIGTDTFLNQDPVIEAQKAYRRVIHHLEAAVRLTDRDADVLPGYLCELGVALANGGDIMGVDRTAEAVARCREAAALPAGRTRAQWPFVQLALAMTLLSAARSGGPHAAAHQDEGRRLLADVARAGGPLGTRAGAMLTHVDLAEWHG